MDGSVCIQNLTGIAEHYGRGDDWRSSLAVDHPMNLWTIVVHP